MLNVKEGCWHKCWLQGGLTSHSTPPERAYRLRDKWWGQWEPWKTSHNHPSPWRHAQWHCVGRAWWDVVITFRWWGRCQRPHTMLQLQERALESDSLNVDTQRAHVWRLGTEYRIHLWRQPHIQWTKSQKMRMMMVDTALYPEQQARADWSFMFIEIFRGANMWSHLEVNRIQSPEKCRAWWERAV